MSDPFAIRMNFKRLYLEKMTSNPASQMRAAAYAVKYREQDEDLHSCILEQLDAVCTFHLAKYNANERSSRTSTSAQI
jgi:CTD kinase subunit gamma